MKRKLDIDTKVETYKTCCDEIYIRITESSSHSVIEHSLCLSPGAAKKLNKFLDKYIKGLENEEK